VTAKSSGGGVGKVPQAEESRGLEDLVPEQEGARKITSFWCPGEEREQAKQTVITSLSNLPRNPAVNSSRCQCTSR